MIKDLISRLTMQKREWLFKDIINGKDVYRWVDCFGVKWLAQSKFGRRVTGQVWESKIEVRFK